ncbi:hypothetical protein AcV7_003331 [Taiwanofungus camphoratus]|nr:hypothetical protein AcV7_003331 [Antrodia cinnamomea]
MEHTARWISRFSTHKLAVADFRPPGSLILKSVKQIAEEVVTFFSAFLRIMVNSAMCCYKELRAGE